MAMQQLTPVLYVDAIEPCLPFWTEFTAAVQSGGAYGENPEASAAFDEACPTHEDYVWTVGMASAPAAEVGRDRSEAGLVNNWSWNEHYLGGKYRRLLAVDGPDHASLLEARNNVIEAGAENPGLMAAFSDVCNGHQDNLYDVQISAP